MKARPDYSTLVVAPWIESGSETKARVRTWWDANPCGSRVSHREVGSQDFFEEIERHRYAQEPHIPRVANFSHWVGKNVLEIGCGLGTDSLQFARAGANVTGIDLSTRSVELAARQLHLNRLNGSFEVGDAENLRFCEETFDLVYANGVFHHTPDVERAVAETYRVLKPRGTAVVMLYHKHSYNYWINICLIRRLAYALLRHGFPPRAMSRFPGAGMNLIQECEHALRAHPRWTTQDLLNNNTDGPGNPLSRVYTRAAAKRLFHQFHSVHTRVHWLVRKNIPLIGRFVPRSVDYQLGRLVGWALYVIAEK